jgi:hypothetical protein
MKRQSFPKLTKLEVRWEDITSESGWKTEYQIKKFDLTTVNTMGYFLESTAKNIKLGHSVSTDGDSDITCIPWGVILSVKELT